MEVNKAKCYELPDFLKPNDEQFKSHYYIFLVTFYTSCRIIINVNTVHFLNLKIIP